jgi:perosamine synthetase
MIPIAKPLIGEEEINAVSRILKSGMLAHGKEVEEFEKEFAKYIGTKYAIATSSGTSALDIALKSLNIKEGDEVITTPFTFIATANSILYQNAKPVFADIDEKTFNLNPDDVLEKITNKTKAIIVVHLYGHPVDIEAFKEIAEDHNLYLIEDACQAHGAEYKNQKVGSFGDVAVFSFYPTKNMTTGEGGMITTNNKEIKRKAEILRNHGQTKKYLHEELGHNMRMTNIAAAIGRVQLKKLDEFNNKRVSNAEKLTNTIKNIDGLTPPYIDKRVKHVFHQYVIKVEDNFGMSRDELKQYLENKGIGTAIHYPIPIHHQPLYQKLGYSKDICPISVEIAKKVLSLPVHPALSEEELIYITNALKELQ